MLVRLKQAREEKGFSTMQLAEMLGVNSTSISNWENGRRQASLDNLIKLSDILGCGVDYLIGRDQVPVSQTDAIPKETLKTLHGQPVWTASRGWMLINSIKLSFILPDLSLIGFNEIQENLYLIPPALSFSLRGLTKPLDLDAVTMRDKVWLEPISCDADLSSELRGWYKIHNRRYAANEFGNRFYLDTYGVKWLAFEDCFGGLT
jgi:transcriptional regulator with XRE-family HTH domain